MDMYNGNDLVTTDERRAARHPASRLLKSGTSKSSQNSKTKALKDLPRRSREANQSTSNVRSARFSTGNRTQANRRKPASLNEDTATPVIIDFSPASKVESGSTEQNLAFGLAHDVLKIGAVPLLTREEEVRLARLIKRGDQAARERMIRANFRLVLKIARDYEHLGLPLADLVSEGIIGLMKAVDRFQPSKGGKLSTYGSWWIKQQIRRGLANQGRTVRLPVHVEGKLYQLGRAEARLRNLLGRDATDDELGSELGIAAKRIARLRQNSIRPSSLDAPVGGDDGVSVGELLADEKAPDPSKELQEKVDHERLRGLLKCLPEREASILALRFGLDGGDEQTLEDVGKRFNLTRERIRQLQNEAFRKLRILLESNKLPAAA